MQNLFAVPLARELLSLAKEHDPASLRNKLSIYLEFAALMRSSIEESGFLAHSLACASGRD
jgi:hypothetical protein